MEVAGLIIEQRYEVPDDLMATVYNKCKRIAEPVWATYDFHGGDVAFCKVSGPAKPH